MSPFQLRDRTYLRVFTKRTALRKYKKICYYVCFKLKFKLTHKKVLVSTRKGNPYVYDIVRTSFVSLSFHPAKQKDILFYQDRIRLKPVASVSTKTECGPTTKKHTHKLRVTKGGPYSRRSAYEMVRSTFQQYKTRRKTLDTDKTTASILNKIS